MVPQAVDDRNNDITFFVIHEYYKDKKERYIQNLVQSSLNHYSQQQNQTNGTDELNRSSSTQNTEQTTGVQSTFGPNLPPNSGSGFTPLANSFQPSGGLQPTANTFKPSNMMEDNQQSAKSTDNDDQNNITGNFQPKTQQFE